MSTNTLYGIFDDEEVLLSSVKEIRSNNIEIEEVFSPFPIHGLDKALGFKETRMAIMAFIYGCLGLSLGALMIYNIMIVDWPQNIGGKPSFSFIENMPAFVPIMFEMTVFHAAHLMVITFYLRSRMWPLKKAENPDPRTTDDHFLIEISTDKPVAGLKKLLKDSGAVEINEVKPKEH